MTASREKCLPYVIVTLVNAYHARIFARDVSDYLTITKEVTSCNVNVIVIDAVTFRLAGIIKHPACEVTWLSHIFHCSKPSFSLICIYRIHKNAAFVY